MKNLGLFAAISMGLSGVLPKFPEVKKKPPLGEDDKAALAAAEQKRERRRLRKLNQSK